MSFIEKVFAATTKIEGLLAAQGGMGMGMRALADSIHPPLGTDIYRCILRIGEVRNRLAHEHGYRYSGNEHTFLQECDWVIAVLMDTRDRVAPTNHRIIALTTSGEDMSMRISDSNCWVAQQQFRAGSEYPSSTAERLVFISGRAVYVKAPNTLHTAGYGFPLQWLNPYRIDALAYVKMTYGFIELIDAGSLLTSDQVPLDIAVKLKLQVMDKEECITRIVVNIVQEREQVANNVMAALRSLVSQRTYRELMRMNHLLASEAFSVVSNTQASDAFRLTGINLLRLGATVSQIDNQFVDRAVQDIEATQLIAAMETRRIQEDMEDLKLRRELKRQETQQQQEIKELEAKATLMAKPGGLELLNPALASERMRLDAELAKVRIHLADLQRARDARSDRNRIRLEEQDKANARSHTINLNR